MKKAALFRDFQKSALFPVKSPKADADAPAFVFCARS